MDTKTLFLLSVLHSVPLKRQTITSCQSRWLQDSACRRGERLFYEAAFIDVEQREEHPSVQLCQPALLSHPPEKDALSPDPSSFQAAPALTRDVYQLPIHPRGRRRVL